ncbi:MAG TPA: hypothetical protein VF980_14380 [Thermoanaerobaculia bacterium]
MNPPRVLHGLLLAVLTSSAALAQSARIDMKDERRAVGREDNIRVDAQLTQDAVTSGSPIGVVWQVENLTNAPVATSAEVSADYDAAARTLVLSVGSEVPSGGAMPRMVVIAAGEKKVLTGATTVHFMVAGAGMPHAAVPRFVQIKASVLRDLTAFATLFEQRVSRKAVLTDAQFTQWMESNDTIVLNALPIHYDVARGRATSAADASIRSIDSAFEVPATRP